MCSENFCPVNPPYPCKNIGPKCWYCNRNSGGQQSKIGDFYKPDKTAKKIVRDDPFI